MLLVSGQGAMEQRNVALSFHQRGQFGL